MHPRALRDQIRTLIEPVIVHLGFDLVAVEWVAGRRATLRVSVDGPEGVGADDCARISHRISPLLDAEDPIPGAYDLEVSTPGMQRPLQRASDFLRFTGFRARIRLDEGFPRRRYTGALRGVSEGFVSVEVDGTVHALPLDGIEAAHLDLDLDTFMSLADGLPPVPGEGEPAAPDGPTPAAGAPIEPSDAPEAPSRAVEDSP